MPRTRISGFGTGVPGSGEVVCGVRGAGGVPARRPASLHFGAAISRIRGPSPGGRFLAPLRLSCYLTHGAWPKRRTAGQTC